MAKEIEGMGIPTTLISAIVPLAATVGASRIVEGTAITHPLGNPSMPKEEELQFRRMLIHRALKAVTTDVQKQLIVGL